MKGERKNEGEIVEKEEAKNEESFEEDELISEWFLNPLLTLSSCLTEVKDEEVNVSKDL